MSTPRWPLDRRRAGILLHPTSLPGGDLGADAYRFVEFMAAAGLSVWQVLPLGPTHTDGSPYQCLSVHAGNPELVDLQWLVDRGWLAPADAPGLRAEPQARHALLRAAQRGFERAAGERDKAALAAFVAARRDWLEDFALYRALRGEHDGQPWRSWPAELRDRHPHALAAARERLTESIAQVAFEQYVFFSQWQALKTHAHAFGVSVFGDMPIFVALDSAEVWAHREYFTLDASGAPQTVAGVPPDYFSASGQRWGNPLYRWDAMQADGFAWWRRRLETQLELFDLVRVDHFRGFEACWEIPAAAATAVEGRWVEAPGAALLSAVYAHFDALPLVAEDLGTITQAVDDLRRRFGLPGMRVLQFAFDGSGDNPHLPHNHERDSVIYCGTHDNDTTLGWLGSRPPAERERVMAYLGQPAEPMPWPLLRCALASVGQLSVVSMQDLLMRGSEARMNTPATTEGNWRWRFAWSEVGEDLAARVAELMALYGR